MILYEVELDMASALRDEYLAWLRDHVAQMLALPGFIDATIFDRSDPPAPPRQSVVVVQYRLRDRAAWDAYRTGPAARMRGAGSARFGGRVHAVRRVLEPL